MTSTKQITLSQLLGAVEHTFDEIFAGKIFTVLAETGDIKNYPDRQYCFFSLIEKQDGEVLAKADAVIWRSHYQSISRFERTTGKRFEKNIRLLFHIEVTYHAVYGMRLRVTDIDTSYTLGEIEKDRRQVLEKLMTLHPKSIRMVGGEYITANKKSYLPEAIRNIALITAPGSDGLRDFMHEIENNPYGYTFSVTQFLTRVQGKDAELDIATAFRQIQKSVSHYDIVVLVRGGGSGLDLGPFDTYEPAAVIAEFPIPVITGVGHERNRSIADMMSHTSVKTPTKAAAFIVEHNVEFEESISALTEEILENAQTYLKDHLRHLDKIATTILPSALRSLMHNSHRLDQYEHNAKLNDPIRILSKGYALVRKKGELSLGVKALQEDDEIEIQFADGKAGAKITHLP